jgi:ATP/maltotriose-dependent transcriptional regulator MalT
VAEASGDELFAVAEASGDKERVAEGRAWRVTFLVELGDLAAAERDVHAIARLADALRQPLYRLVAASRRSTLAVLAGRFDEALRLACEAWQIGVRGREPDADAVHWGQIFAIFSETGVPDAERERMEATARRLAALSPLGDAHAAGLALICLRRGHTDEALARFEALARRGFADLPRDMTYVWCLTLLATLCVALGDLGRAAKLYDALAPTRVDAPWAPAR